MIEILDPTSRIGFYSQTVKKGTRRERTKNCQTTLKNELNSRLFDLGFQIINHFHEYVFFFFASTSIYRVTHPHIYKDATKCIVKSVQTLNLNYVTLWNSIGV